MSDLVSAFSPDGDGAAPHVEFVRDLGDGTPKVLLQNESLRVHCFDSMFQILFKDLFRFLLVYVLFMIGYASGMVHATARISF